MRNNFFIKDYPIWFDMLDLLSFFNKDLTNVKYVCPESVNALHDRLCTKKAEIDRKERIANQKRSIKVAQEKYLKEKGHFFGLAFTDNNITIKVIDSVEKFLEEGKQLNHCVFTNKYYKKQNSLILSARINDQPIETIEISLQNMEIIQSRGKNNKATDYNNQILQIVNKNLGKIAQLHNEHIKAS